MKNYPAHRLTVIALVCTATVLLWAGVDVAGAQAGDIDEVASPNGVAPKLELTAAQRSAIYQAVSQDKGKVAPTPSARPRVGGDPIFAPLLDSRFPPSRDTLRRT